MALALLFLLSSQLNMTRRDIGIHLSHSRLLRVPSYLLMFSVRLFFLYYRLTTFLLRRVRFERLHPTRRETRFHLYDPMRFGINLVLHGRFPTMLHHLVLLGS